jgi:hypothetical protein
MRNLLIILIAFIAVLTFIRAFEKPELSTALEAAEIGPGGMAEFTIGSANVDLTNP